MNNGGGVYFGDGIILCYFQQLLNIDIVQVLVVKSVISAMLGSFRTLLSVQIMRYRLELFHTMKDQTVFPVVNASTIGRGFSKVVKRFYEIFHNYDFLQIYKLILLSELRKQRR